jgi:hypothetical protein
MNYEQAVSGLLVSHYTETSCNNALNDYFDHTLLSLPHQFKSILGLFELVSISDKSLHINLATGNEINRC